MIQSILGFDQSSDETGFAFLVEGKLKDYGKIACPSNWNLHKKVRFMCARVAELVVKYNPDLVVKEAGIVCKNMKSAISLGEVAGAVRCGAAPKIVGSVDNGFWKKHLLGYNPRGADIKDVVKAGVAYKYGVMAEGYDVSDAIAMTFTAWEFRDAILADHQLNLPTAEMRPSKRKKAAK